MTLNYLRNKVVVVEPLSDGTLKVSWRLTDDLFEAKVQLMIEPPELEIIKAEARWERNPTRLCRDAAERIKKVEGISVGSGLRKILAGLLVEEDGISILMDAVLDCGNAVILHYTRPGIQVMEGVTDPDERLKATRERVISNPRLVRSCISFQDDSPIMKGLGL